MEIVIAVFIGAWLSGAGILAYNRLKKEFKEEADRKRGDAE